jgi:UPF0755 protein
MPVLDLDGEWIAQWHEPHPAAGVDLSAQPETRLSRRGRGRARGRGREPMPRKVAVAGGSVAASLAALLALFASVAPVGPSRGHKTIDIPPAATLQDIADRLEHERLIRSRQAFRLLAMVVGTDQTLVAGSYKLPTGAWVWTVVRALSEGDGRVALRFAAGATLWQIAAEVEQAGLGTAAAFLDLAADESFLAKHGVPATTAEGYLYPGDYRFLPGSGADAVLAALLGRFNESLRPFLPQDQALAELMTLASIVERETPAGGDLRRVAGVFRNRLARDMRLQSTASVRYALASDRPLQPADLKLDSPYNTYRRGGLPPGPIGNPSMEAVLATRDAEQHEFLFFVPGPDGLVFTKTFEEHSTAWADLRQREP